MARQIDWKDLPLAIRADAKGISRAAANTLNDVAFNAVKKLPLQAQRDMKFRGNARAALGWQVEKANFKHLESSLKTNRGWFLYHSDEGNRRVSSSKFTFLGEDWIFIPRQKATGVVNRRGAIHKSAYSRIFVIKTGSGASVFYRGKGKRQGKKSTPDAEYIGTAVKQTNYHEDTDWDGLIQREWEQSFHALFSKNVHARIAFKTGLK